MTFLRTSGRLLRCEQIRHWVTSWADVAADQDRLILAFEREVTMPEIGDVCGEGRTHRSFNHTGGSHLQWPARSVDGN